MFIDDRNSRFPLWRHLLRGMRRGVASPESAAESSACGRGNTVGLTSILD